MLCLAASVTYIITDYLHMYNLNQSIWQNKLKKASDLISTLAL